MFHESFFYSKLIILQSLAAGVPVMHSDWIVAMSDKKQFLDPSSYFCGQFRLHNQTDKILGLKKKAGNIFDNILLHLGNG